MLGCSHSLVASVIMGYYVMQNAFFSLHYFLLQDQAREHRGTGGHLRESRPPLPDHAAVSSSTVSFLYRAERAQFDEPQGQFKYCYRGEKKFYLRFGRSQSLKKKPSHTRTQRAAQRHLRSGGVKACRGSACRYPTNLLSDCNSAVT